jgi:hypothetical protein
MQIGPPFCGQPVQSAQVPEEPQVASWSPATHEPPEQQKSPSHVPSVPAELHWLMQVPSVALPPVMSQVGVWPPQAVQTPVMPQASLAVPGWQVPSVAAEQQPPLQSWVELQAVVQCPAVVSQAIPTGHSLVWVQEVTQIPPAGGPVTASQVRELAVQSVQVPPSVPQAVSAFPTSHVPLRQQPPLQVRFPPQFVEQMLGFAVVSQA